MNRPSDGLYEKDFYVDKPFYPHRETWSIAFPMILSSLTVPIVGIVDTAVMGHLPEAEYLGGVALGSMIFTFLFWGFGFLRMGTTGITAQAYGGGNTAELRLILGRGVLLAVLLAVVICGLQWPVLQIALWLIDGSARVELLAGDYFNIRIWAVPAVLIRYVLLGWFLGVQSVRPLLYITVLINALNVVLDLVFVIVFDMKVEGVAWATVVAEYAGLLFACGFVKQQLSNCPGAWRLATLWNFSALRRMMLINQQIFIRTLLLIFSFAFFTAQSADLGDVTLAANAVLKNFLLLLSFGLDGIAHAAEVLVGKAIGNGNRKKLMRYVVVTGIWSGIGALAYSLFFLLFGGIIVGLLTDIQEVRLTALTYLPWVWAAPLIGMWSYWLDGVFIGATKTKAMRNVMIISTILYLLVWYLSQPLGNHGLWLALLAFLALRGIGMGAAFMIINRRNNFIARA